MIAVGDRVQVPSKRVGQAPRDGVVTGVSGSLLRVTWSGGEESTIFPSMGSLMVVGKGRVRTEEGRRHRQEGCLQEGCLQEGCLQEGCVETPRQEGGQGDDHEGCEEGDQEVGEAAADRDGEVVQGLGQSRQAAQVKAQPKACSAPAAIRFRSPVPWRSPTPGERPRRRRGAASRDAACRCVR